MITRMTMHKDIRPRKRMIMITTLHTTMTMTMHTTTRTPLRPLCQLLRQDTTTLKRMAMITPILTPIHTHEPPQPECRHRAAHGRGPRH